MLGTRADVKKKEGRPPHTFIVGTKNELNALKIPREENLRHLRVFEASAFMPYGVIGIIQGHGYAKFMYPPDSTSFPGKIILACADDEPEGVLQIGETNILLGNNITQNYHFYEVTGSVPNIYHALGDGTGFHAFSETELELPEIDPESFLYGIVPSRQDIPKDGDMGVTLGQIDLITGQAKKYLYIDTDWVLLTKDILGARRTPYNVFGAFGSYIDGWPEWERNGNYAGDPRYMRRNGVTISPGEDSMPSNVPLIFRGGYRGKNFPQRLLKDHVHSIPSHIRSLNGFYEHLGVFKLNAMPLGTLAYANISEMFEYLMPTYFCAAWKNPHSMYYPGQPAVCDSCKPVDEENAEYGMFVKTADKAQCTTPSLVLNDIIWGPDDNEGREFNLGLTTWISLTHCAIPAFSPYFNSGAKWFPYEPCFTPLNRRWARFWDAGWKPDDGPICIQCCDNIHPVVTRFGPSITQDFKAYKIADYSLLRANNIAVPVIYDDTIDEVDLTFAYASLGVSFEDNVVAEGYINEVNTLALYNKDLTPVTSQFHYGFWGVKPSELYGPRWYDSTEYDPMVTAREVSLNVPIVIEFSKPINRFSVISDWNDPNISFKVYKCDESRVPSTIIDGTLEWTEDSMIVQFFPKFPWDASSTYLVQLEGCVIQDGPSTRLNTTTSLVYTDVLDNAYFNSENLYEQELAENFDIYTPVSWPVLGGPLLGDGWSGLWSAYSALTENLDSIEAIDDVLDNYNYATRTVTRRGAYGNHLVGSIFPWGQWGVTNSPTGEFYSRPVYVPGVVTSDSTHPMYIEGALDSTRKYSGNIWTDGQTETRHIFDEKWGPDPGEDSNDLLPTYPGKDCTTVSEESWGYPLTPTEIGRFEFKFQTSTFIKTTKPISGDEHAPHSGIIKLEYLEPVHVAWLEQNFNAIFQMLAFSSEPSYSDFTKEAFFDATNAYYTVPEGDDPYTEDIDEGGEKSIIYEGIYNDTEIIPLRLVVNTPLYTVIEVDTVAAGSNIASYQRRLYGNRYHCLRVDSEFLMKKVAPPAVESRGTEVEDGYAPALKQDYYLPFRTSPFFVGTWPPDNSERIPTTSKIVIAFNHGVNPETVTLRSALGEGNPMGTRESGELVECGILGETFDASSFILNDPKNINLTGSVSTFNTPVFVGGLGVETGPFNTIISWIGDRYRVEFTEGLPDPPVAVEGQKLYLRIFDFLGQRTYYSQLGMWGDDERIIESGAFVPKYNIIVYDQTLPIFGSKGQGGYNVYYKGMALQNHEYDIELFEEYDIGYLFIYDFQKPDRAFKAIFRFNIQQPQAETPLTLVLTVENDFLAHLVTKKKGESFTWDAPAFLSQYSMVYNSIPYPWDGDIRGWDAKVWNKKTNAFEPANLFAIDEEVFTFAGQDSTDVILFKPYSWLPSDWQLNPASVAVYKCEPEKYNGSYGLHDQTQLLSGVLSFAKEEDDPAILDRNQTPNYFFGSSAGETPRYDGGVNHYSIVPSLGEIQRIVFTPYAKRGEDALEENSTYAIVVGNDIESIEGASPREPFHLMYDYTSFFTTNGFIESTEPEDNALSVNPYSDIQIYFGTSIYVDSLNQTTVILRDDAGSLVPYDATYYASSECLVIVPTHAMLSEMRYHCKLTRGITSDGNRRFHLNNDYNFSFLVQQGHAIDMEII